MNYYGDLSSLFAIFGIGIAIIGILVLVYVIVSLVALWKLFKKAGRNGWEALIPIYSYWVLVEISGLNWWWFLLIIIDVVFKIEIDGLTLAINLFVFFASFNCYYNIARKFGKDKTTSIFAGIFPFIFVWIFAFSKKEFYNASIPVSANGIFGTSDMNRDTNNNYQSNGTYQSTEDVDKVNTTDNIDNKEYSFCGDCGTKLDKDVRFCPNCGKEK